MAGGRKPGGPKTGGRQKGTPNKATAELKAAAQVYTEEALETLAQIMRNKKAPPAARVGAAKELLDRGHGKATQPLSDPNGGPLTVRILDNF